ADPRRGIGRAAGRPRGTDHDPRATPAGGARLTPAGDASPPRAIESARLRPTTSEHRLEPALKDTQTPAVGALVDVGGVEHEADVTVPVPVDARTAGDSFTEFSVVDRSSPSTNTRARRSPSAAHWAWIVISGSPFFSPVSASEKNIISSA